MKMINKALVCFMAALTLTLSLPAQAGIVGTEQMLAQDSQATAHAAAMATVQTFLARDQVTKQLASWGVAPAAVDARVAALSDSELQRLATTIDTQPAGGGVLGLIGLVVVVLVILELLGAINIFSTF